MTVILFVIISIAETTVRPTTVLTVCCVTILICFLLRGERSHFFHILMHSYINSFLHFCLGRIFLVRFAVRIFSNEESFFQVLHYSNSLGFQLLLSEKYYTWTLLCLFYGFLISPYASHLPKRGAFLLPIVDNPSWNPGWNMKLLWSLKLSSS